MFDADVDAYLFYVQINNHTKWQDVILLKISK